MLTSDCWDCDAMLGGNAMRYLTICAVLLLVACNAVGPTLKKNHAGGAVETKYGIHPDWGYVFFELAEIEPSFL